VWRVVFVAIAACYRPAAETACGVRCAADGSCPGSLRCIAGLCQDSNGTCGSGPNDGPRPMDAPPDVSIDAPPGCYGNHLGVTLCDGDAPAGTLHPVATINTTTGTGCTISGTMCLVASQDIDITQTVKVRGARPIIFFASRTITLEASMLIDAASTYGSPAGPGGNDVACSASNGGGMENATYGGGGGAGGTFQGGGGLGGAGVGTSGANGNAGQPDTPLTAVTALRGGCPGGEGGGCTSFATGGGGGSGGGAVYLLAGQQITLFGTVNASGAGAAPGEPSSACGGGGGGSGGLIVLDAPTIQFGNALLLASGGGGGGSYNAGTANAGTEPTITNPTAAGSGGMGDPSGFGAGGDGSSNSSLSGAGGVAGVTLNANSGGGGGGGGAGFIWAYCTTQTYMGITTSVPDISFHAP
jgi:hypothetical protein